jgi:hypothetical protein
MMMMMISLKDRFFLLKHDQNPVYKNPLESKVHICAKKGLKQSLKNSKKYLSYSKTTLKIKNIFVNI